MVLHDEIALVWAIIVKASINVASLIYDHLSFFHQARSSAKRKQLFKNIQTRVGSKSLILLLDMAVCWSSTYIMLNQAEVL